MPEGFRRGSFPQQAGLQNFSTAKAFSNPNT
jgi:hypothetical protein